MNSWYFPLIISNFITDEFIGIFPRLFQTLYTSLIRNMLPNITTIEPAHDWNVSYFDKKVCAQFPLFDFLTNFPYLIIYKISLI